jgi:hypothetical protein
MLRVVMIAALLAACTQSAYRASPQRATTHRRASVLEDQPAVRHREEAFIVAGGLLAAPLPPPSAEVLASPEVRTPEKLVVEVWIGMTARDVDAMARAVRARVEADGGRVVSENLHGNSKSAWSLALELRLPPGKQPGFIAWLDGRGSIESRRMLASDVSKQLFDQELALANLRLAMTRLQQLVATDVPIKELLEIETEMTRVRGEIEKLQGEHRWLQDRVEYATINLTVDREGGPVALAPDGNIQLGPRLSTLVLLDPEGRPRTRIGGGVTVQVKRYLTFDLDVFPRRGTDGRAVIASIGGALHSSFFGGGNRRYLNPYLGVRLGYGYLSGSGVTVFAGELGVELYKQRHVMVDATTRVVALLGGSEVAARRDVALHAALGVLIPF